MKTVKTTYNCDLCGNEITESGHTNVSMSVSDKQPIRLDFCKPCVSELCAKNSFYERRTFIEILKKLIKR
jgi:hypothetical protein